MRQFHRIKQLNVLKDNLNSARAVCPYFSPDKPFHNFRASRSGDRRILWSPQTSFDGFCSSRNVKGFVGLLSLLIYFFLTNPFEVIGTLSKVSRWCQRNGSSLPPLKPRWIFTKNEEGKNPIWLLIPLLVYLHSRSRPWENGVHFSPSFFFSFWLKWPGGILLFSSLPVYARARMIVILLPLRDLRPPGRSRRWTTSRRWRTLGWRRCRSGTGKCACSDDLWRRQCRCERPDTGPRGRRNNLENVRIKSPNELVEIGVKTKTFSPSPSDFIT